MPNIDPATTCRGSVAAPLARAPCRGAPRRRGRRGGRSGAAVAPLSLTVAAGAAVAEEGTGGATPSGSGGAAAGGTALLQPKGSIVAALQRRLGIPADGVYGPQTRRAVRRFQRASGLQVDGIAGPATLSALGLAAVPVKPAQEATATVPARFAARLAQIAQCESGGDPTAVSPTAATAASTSSRARRGGRWAAPATPPRPPEAEQDRRAAELLRRDGQRALADLRLSALGLRGSSSAGVSGSSAQPQDARPGRRRRTALAGGPS